VPTLRRSGWGGGTTPQVLIATALRLWALWSVNSDLRPLVDEACRSLSSKGLSKDDARGASLLKNAEPDRRSPDPSRLGGNRPDDDRVSVSYTDPIIRRRFAECLLVVPR
jgi:hypothetical protein